MLSVDWYKVYERLAIGFAEKLARLSSKTKELSWFTNSSVKPIIFTTQKMKFSFKDLFNKCEQIRSFMRICLPLLKKFLAEKFIFCALICASKWTENCCEEENNLFLASLFTFFEKNLQIFYCSVFTCKVLRPFVIYLFDGQSTVLVYSS